MNEVKYIEKSVIISLCMLLLIIIGIYDLPIERLAEFPVIMEYSQRGYWVLYFCFAILSTCGIGYLNKYKKKYWLKL